MIKIGRLKHTKLILYARAYFLEYLGFTTLMATSIKILHAFCPLLANALFIPCANCIHTKVRTILKFLIFCLLLGILGNKDLTLKKTSKS